MMILNMVYRVSSLSVTDLMVSHNMEDPALMIKTRWLDVHGPPESIPAEPEFQNDAILALCTDNNVIFDTRTARRHKKIGTVQ